jgi:polyphosphate kinase 2 (PPK2 family)
MPFPRETDFCFFKMQIKLAELEHKEVAGTEEYRLKLREMQLKLLGIQLALADSRRSLIIVVEGPDAAGKGGAIKRMVEKLDPRFLSVHAISKPTAEEISRHYQWRVWTKLPPYGRMAIFDRSWYGRVLVERVEGFATKAEWKRAYHEINEFERLLTDDGCLIVKIYLHITKEEQLARFKKRESDPHKRWKMNDEDWRNRGKWGHYIEAAEEMFALTSPRHAPWNIVGANFKWHARLRVLKTVLRSLEKLDLK